MASTYSQSWEGALFKLAQEARYPAAPRTPMRVKNKRLLEHAYASCEVVISKHGKTFNMASSLLPPEKRRAIRALYAFCRVTDNIVDCSDASLVEKEAELASWRYRAVTASPPRDDPVAIAWADTRLRYGVPYKYAEQLIDGVARDLRQKRYQTFPELATYAYSVASTVGLMSLRIIGTAPGFSEEDAIPYAIKLGLALQLTNILRDVGEDWRADRVYLPSDELHTWGVTEADLDGGVVDDRWRRFMRFQVERNLALYDEAWPCVAMFNWDGRFAVAAACAMYRAILKDIEVHDYDVFSRRAYVSTWGKLRRLPGIWWHNW
ncbi:MAG TPA: squalene/phytoene synthase family protein [Chloroflexia bacterium]|nr:squalene/phytoene synthase family protein [Chloroflexia bacterium]